MSSKITIKKKRTGNEYLLTEEGVWVRNFCKADVPAIDINALMSPDDYHCALSNEIENRKRRHAVLDTQGEIRKKIVIVSDGYDFDNKHLLLSKLPADVSVIATNKALSKWKLVGTSCPEKEKKAIAYYVVNNPYSEVDAFLPKENRYYPKCVASNRTNPAFLSNYRGNIFTYKPVVDQAYSGLPLEGDIMLDDYRNSICAAICMAYKFGVQKLLTFCCDDSFSQERAGSAKLENGLWSYPQHQMSHNIIDGNLYWLKTQGVDIKDHSSGPNFVNAEYITQEQIVSFFA